MRWSGTDRVGNRYGAHLRIVRYKLKSLSKRTHGSAPITTWLIMHRLCHDMEGAFMAAMERRVDQ